MVWILDKSTIAMLFRFVLALSSLSSLLDVSVTGDGDYDSIKELEGSILSPANYSTTLRPVRDQTQPIYIEVTFSLVAVVSVDNVKQELITNGFIFMFWQDERNSWDSDYYGGVERLTPTPKQIWRPRLLLINTLDKRDPFEDDYTFVEINQDGSVGWIPGGLFKTYCALNMEKFPFDVQNCQIKMCPMSHTNKTIIFVARDEVNLAFFSPNPGWELQKSTIVVEDIKVGSDEPFSCPTFNFQLKRRPTTIILNVIIPVILLSVLNNLVFLIPVDSGEKISYGITVLLALTVFLSMVSTMTPQVSDVVPALTIYLFILLLSSVLTVAAAIFSVFLHHVDEKEESSMKNKSGDVQESDENSNAYKTTAVTPLAIIKDPLPDDTRDGTVSHDDTIISPGDNPYRVIAKHINKVFFLVMCAITLGATIWYLKFSNS